MAHIIKALKITALQKSKSMKIAFVEDGAQVHARVRHVLQLGFPHAAITSFQTLADAAAFAMNEQQDYWLIDLGLPDGSGIALIGILRKRFPDTNILVLTVFSDARNIVSSIQAGANGYLLKEDLQTEVTLPLMIRAMQDGGTPLSPLVASRLLAHMKAMANQPIPPAAAHNLAPREIELLQLLSRGYSYQEAADLMQISLGTVQTFVKRMYTKLAVTSRAEAIFEGRQLKVIE
jgi:DNA-binding NarL/FixJ family response regulator